MLRRECVPHLRNGRLNRTQGYLVVAMCWYPRFVRKELIDEYLRPLAPDRVLFSDFKSTARKTGDHNRAFADVRYEARFRLSEEAVGHLDRLAEMARLQDVFLLCQCDDSRRCHVDLLLMAARHRSATPCEKPRFEYPVWAARLDSDS